MAQRIPVSDTARLSVEAAHELAMEELALYVGPLERIAERTGHKRQAQGARPTTKSALRNPVIVTRMEEAGFRVGRPTLLPITPEVAREIVARFPDSFVQDLVREKYGEEAASCLKEVHSDRGEPEPAALGQAGSGAVGGEEYRPGC